MLQKILKETCFFYSSSFFFWVQVFITPLRLACLDLDFSEFLRSNTKYSESIVMFIRRLLVFTYTQKNETVSYKLSITIKSQYIYYFQYCLILVIKKCMIVPLKKKKKYDRHIGLLVLVGNVHSMCNCVCHLTLF